MKFHIEPEQPDYTPLQKALIGTALLLLIWLVLAALMGLGGPNL